MLNMQRAERIGVVFTKSKMLQNKPLLRAEKNILSQHILARWSVPPALPGHQVR